VGATLVSGERGPRTFPGCQKVGGPFRASAPVRAQCLVGSTPRSAFRAEARPVLAGLTGKLPADIFAPPP